MEKSQIDFESYMKTLEKELDVDSSCKGKICLEIRQNLYDKYRELLIKGYDIDSGVAATLSSFEDPKRLADMFNRLYIEENHASFLNKEKAILIVLAATLIMAFFA